MDCKRCTEDLTAYLDGELSPADSEQMHSHLATCATCADELRSFQEAAGFLDAHKRELGLRLGSWSAIRARISAEKSPSWFGFPIPTRWRTAFATLAFVAILAFGYAWYQQVQERSLDAYISQYIKAREASRSFHRAVAGANAGFRSQNLALDNPFMEAKVGLDLNPFQSED